MDKEFIELGCGMDSGYGGGPMGEGKKHYPCFYFTCDEEIELPDGEFKFMAIGRKVEDSENTRDEENPRYRYEIEVHGFKPMGMQRKMDDMTNVAEAFKKAFAKAAKDKGAVIAGVETED